MERLNFNDNFEMLYLRHDYLKKIQNIKTDPKYIKKYSKIITITGRKMYNKYKFNFERMGFGEEDIVSIANIYAIGYIGIYSINNNPQYKERFVKKYQEENNGNLPTQEELDHKERNNMINFLRQKFHHCSTVCARKSRNIVGNKNIHLIVAETSTSKPACEGVLIKNYKKFGYRKITAKEFKEIKNRAKQQKTPSLTDRDGFRVIPIDICGKSMTEQEYHQIFQNKQNPYNSDPEQCLIDREEGRSAKYDKAYFDGLSSKDKKRILGKFIRKFKNSKFYKKEVSLARKMFREI